MVPIVIRPSKFSVCLKDGSDLKKTLDGKQIVYMECDSKTSMVKFKIGKEVYDEFPLKKFTIKSQNNEEYLLRSDGCSIYLSKAQNLSFPKHFKIAANGFIVALSDSNTSAGSSHSITHTSSNIPGTKSGSAARNDHKSWDESNSVESFSKYDKSSTEQYSHNNQMKQLQDIRSKKGEDYNQNRQSTQMSAEKHGGQSAARGAFSLLNAAAKSILNRSHLVHASDAKNSPLPKQGEHQHQHQHQYGLAKTAAAATHGFASPKPAFKPATNPRHADTDSLVTATGSNMPPSGGGKSLPIQSTIAIHSKSISSSSGADLPPKKRITPVSIPADTNSVACNTHCQQSTESSHSFFTAKSSSSTSFSNLGRMEGIRNLGNTCYMGAVTQALLALPELSKDLNSTLWSELLADSVAARGSISLHHSCAKQLSLLMQEKAALSGKPMDLSALKSAISYHSSRFKGNEQQDAQEFLCALLDSVHDECAARLKTIAAFLPAEILSPASVMHESGLKGGEQSCSGRTDRSITSTGSNSSGGAASTVTGISTLGEDEDAENAVAARMSQWRTDSPGDINAMDNGSVSAFVGGKRSLEIDGMDEAGSDTKIARVSSELKTGTVSPLTATPGSSAKPVVSPGDGNHSESSAPAATESHATSPSIQVLPAPFSSLLPTLRHFHTEVRVQLNCRECMHAPTPRTDFYRDFSLDLDRPEFADRHSQGIHLEALLQSFFAEEVRDLSCEKCKNAQATACATSSLTVLPSVLVLHLKRFQYSPSLQSFTKLRSKVVFPEVLTIPSVVLDADVRGPDLSRTADLSMNPSKLVDSVMQVHDDTLAEMFTHGSAMKTPMRPSLGNESMGHSDSNKATPESAKGQIDPFSSDMTSSNGSKGSRCTSADGEGSRAWKYKLAAVVRHIGSGAFAGHYTCDISNAMTPRRDFDRTPNEVRSNSIYTGAATAWSRCNDAMISPVTLEAVLEEQETPYILFYTLK